MCFKNSKSYHLFSINQYLQKSINFAKIKDNSLFKFIVSPIHEGIKPFKCDTCQVSFGQKSNLDRHIAFAHEGWDVHSCRISSTRF